MKYIVSLSFGKDSLAMLIEIIRRKLPLDYVIFCDIKFNDNISGEHPLMAEWIPYAENILKEKFNVEVIHLTAKKNFIEQFYTIKQKGKHSGDIYGYPLPFGAWCNYILKLTPIRDFINDIIANGESVTEYIGIAKDEPKRLTRYQNIQTEKHKYITLADLDISEDEALQICKDNNLLSPIYNKSFRGGCWFCPKQSNLDLYDLWKNYPILFSQLEGMEKYSHNSFKPNKTLSQIRRQFEMGKIPKNRKAKNKFKQLSIFD